MRASATKTTSLIAFTLPSTPYSVHMARFYIRAALAHHELGDYIKDAETVSSELVTNAIMHAGGPKFGLEVMHLADFGAVAIIVTDPSPDPPIKRDPAGSSEHGRGLNIVEALSASWGWRTEDSGKAVYAILAREASDSSPGGWTSSASERGEDCQPLTTCLPTRGSLARREGLR
jgi:anti-sigma regulatory factor (Ser/Thr protein kinase)